VTVFPRERGEDPAALAADSSLSSGRGEGDGRVLVMASCVDGLTGGVETETGTVWGNASSAVGTRRSGLLSLERDLDLCPPLSPFTFSGLSSFLGEFC